MRATLLVAACAVALAVVVAWQVFSPAAPSLAPATPLGPATQLLGGSSGEAPGELVSVAGWHGAIAVADRKARRILVLDPTGAVEGRFGPDTGLPLKEPAGISQRPGTDELYVLDRGGPALLRLGPDGGLRGQIDLASLRTYGPNGLLALPDSRIAIADTGGSRVLVLDESGHVVQEIGPGQAPLKQPFAIAPLPGGALAVTEHERNALVILKRDGSVQAQHDLPTNPEGLASDSDGRVYVPDAAQNVIRELDGSAREIGTFPAPIPGASEVALIGQDLYILAPAALARQPLSGIGTGAAPAASAPTNTIVSWTTDDPIRLAFLVLLVVVVVLVVRRRGRANHLAMAVEAKRSPESAPASGTRAPAVLPAAPGPTVRAPAPELPARPAGRSKAGAGAQDLPGVRPEPHLALPRWHSRRFPVGRAGLAVALLALVGLAWTQARIAAQAPLVATTAAHPGTDLLGGLATLLVVQVVLAALVGAALPRVSAASGRVGATEGAALGGIVAVAALLRLLELGSLPLGLWYDTAENGNVALRILGDPTYRPVFVGGATQLPAFFLYLVAGAIATVGANPLAVRLPSALFGLSTVPAIWWLGRRIGGPVLGLAAAFVLATSHWHVDFSRLGLSSAAVPLALCLALVLSHVALRAGRTRSMVIGAATAGVVAALGIWAYPAAVFVPVAVAGLVVWWTAQAPLARWRRAVAVCCVAGVVSALALLPLATEAVAHPDTVFQRPTTVLADSDGSALVESAWQHVLMFTVRGDRNGRHNLPGAPELGAYSALFLAGVGYAALRPRRAVFLLLPGTLLFLVSGIVTLPFEAPQSHRVLPAVVPAALLIALPIAALARRGAIWAAPVAVWLAVAGAADAGLYFDAQTRDGAVLRDNNLPETDVARALKTLGPGWAVLGPDGFVGHPTVRFLAGEHRQVAVGMDAAATLPLDASGPVAIVGSLDEPALLARARALYPTAPFETLGAPDLPQPLVGVLAVDAETQRQSLGWLADAADGTQSRVPPDGLAASPVTTWHALLEVPATRSYTIQATDADIWIDGTKVLSAPAGQAARLLPAGAHDLRVRLSAPSTTPGVRIDGATTFALPAPGGLVFTRAPDGQPPITRVDVAPYEIFDGIWGQHWSARWDGSLYAEGGPYEFRMHGRSRATLRIDGTQVVQSEGDVLQTGSASLTPGWHAISIDYRDDEPYARLYLSWKPPGASSFAPIPDSALRPSPPQ